MNATIAIAIIAAVIIIAIVVAWILTSNKAKAAFKNELNMKVEELGRKETEVRTLAGQVAERDADLIRKEADVRTAEALRDLPALRNRDTCASVRRFRDKAVCECAPPFPVTVVRIDDPNSQVPLRL